MAINLSNIQALAEFERAGIVYEFAGGDEVKICCPFHADSSPSCFINIYKRLFKCQTAGCEANGDVIDLIARYLKTPRFVVVTDLATRYDLEEGKIIDPQVIERHHQAIWKAEALRNELYRRGLNDQLIRYYRLGEDKGRISIPVTSPTGAYINIRSYLPGAPGKDKMRNMPGYGGADWFPVEQLYYRHIVLTGGECKAIVGAYQLNEHEIGCITVTCGEGNLPAELVKQLAGKLVYVVMDIDAAGRKAAARHCEHIRIVADFVSDILLPLDITKHPKGDLNDFAAEGGDLKSLIDVCTEYVPDRTDWLKADESEPIPLDLGVAIHAENANKRMLVKGLVSSMDTTPYLIPKEVVIECSKNQKECGICPVYLQKAASFTIPAESPAILEFIGTSDSVQLEVVKKLIGIPKSCRASDFVKLSEYNVEDTFISPQLDMSSKSSDRQPIPAMCVGTGLAMNEAYDMTGKLLANPKNQQATLLISNHKTSVDALSNFQLTEPEQLGNYWPTEFSVEAIQEKLDHIYADYEANITRIYQRQDMHFIVDLAYHSPLFIEFDGRHIKGWVDTLIMGDSSHGKSEVTFGLQKHYGLGHTAEMAMASVAGILGGMEKMGERWCVSWGIIPMNDRRLVILDEIKDAPVEILGKLTDMRSSGIAQVTKIGKHWKTRARTRQIWLSNPRSDMKMSQQTFGIKAISELIGSPEDVRRFDVVLLVADSEIDAAEINKLHSERPTVDHFYTSQMSRQLVLWAWTRGDGQVKFSDAATARVLREASALCATFTDVIPLIDRGSTRYKLARLAAALAARLFSCSEDYETLIVEECHVEYISQFLRRIYSSSVFGYLEFTEAQRLLLTLVDPEMLELKIQSTPYPRDFCKLLLSRDFIELNDLVDWTTWDKEQSQDILSLFVRKHAFVRAGRGAYRKSALFIEFIKRLIESGNLADRPAHIPERF